MEPKNREAHHNDMSNLQEELERVVSELETERKYRERLLNESQELSQKLKSMKRSIKDTQRKRNKYKKRANLLTQSRSWRYLQPLRKIGRLLRGEKSADIRVKTSENVTSKSLSDKHLRQANSSKSNKKQKPGKNSERKIAQNKINELKTKLHNLGFEEKATSELWNIIKDGSNGYLQRLAARELARWYAVQGTDEGAKQCLKLLDIVVNKNKDKKQLRMAAILRATCYEILGDINKAKAVLMEQIEAEEHADLYLAYSNLESNIADRLNWINKALKMYEIPSLKINTTSNLPYYDSLYSDSVPNNQELNSHKVSVIVPAYNAADTILTTLNSVVSQTWSNLEIIVVDDCSTDHTLQVVTEFAKKDSRIKVLQTEENSGPYVARNIALKHVTGDFITINDADDWSHPLKIEKQVLHLINNSEIMGNTSQQARATADLQFRRWVNYGVLIHTNTSSFMFRKEPVLERLGNWDSVRFGADNEFVRRIIKIFGEHSVVNLSTGPLSFQRQSDGSLVDNKFFGIRAHYVGARKEYLEMYTHYHQNSNALKYDFPQVPRPYAIPEPMRPVRMTENDNMFDVVYATDFRLDDDTIDFVQREILQLKKAGNKIGLVQLSSYDVDPKREMDPRIREIINGNDLRLVVYGEKIKCHHLVIRHMPTLQDVQKYIPTIDADVVHGIIDEGSAERLKANPNDFQIWNDNIYKYFNKKADWHPLNWDVRRNLLNDFNSHFSSENWSLKVVHNESDVEIELSNLNLNVLENETTVKEAGTNKDLENIISKLISDAEEALTRGPYSVIDKTTLPPSGDPQDYWHIHPYWWPNPNTPDGLPYVRRDGERAPGTRMYEPDSEKYDRTRLQRVFDDSLILALAWKFTGESKYAEHGALILNRFFIDPNTRMNPHLNYSQVRMGINDSIGSSTGIIEMKDLYYYLDAVKLLHMSGAVTNETIIDFKLWLSEYLEWLLESKQGKEERRRRNNHGTYYDLQVASIASFLDDIPLLIETIARAQSRIAEQFSNDGSQPLELERTITQHYCCFNLQGWVNLAQIASRHGIDLWSYKAVNGASLTKGVEWFLKLGSKQWPYEQIDKFDLERLDPIQHATKNLVNVENQGFEKSLYEIKPVFDPHDGIRPYWNLALGLFKPKETQQESLTTGNKEDERYVQDLKFKLTSLGFSERAQAELWDIVNNEDGDKAKLASRELSLWYANQRNESDARKALAYMPIFLDGEMNEEKTRQAAIITAECYELLGNAKLARLSLAKAITESPHPDLFLAFANLEPISKDRLAWINRALQAYGISKIELPKKRIKGKSDYDSIYVEINESNISENTVKENQVTVIVPAYNAEDTIQTTIESVLNQTWSNLQIIVVDDCSTDRTREIVAKYADLDPRIELIKTERNGGPYIARNIALKKAAGMFVTCNDADDWSHPEKIETQVKHLLENPNIIANTSQQARATQNLMFYRRGNYGYLIFENMSSLMFRKKQVLEALGNWDSVRFAADNEFIRRLRRVFGNESVVYLNTGPLSFQRQSDSSLTANSAFGYHGYFMGARLEYRDSHNYYHSQSKDLKYEFPQRKRPFAVPEPLKPTYSKNDTKHFDIIIAADFRLKDSKMLSTLIEQAKKQDKLVGLVQLSAYHVDYKKARIPEIRKLLDKGYAEIVVYGQNVSCDKLVVSNPELLNDQQRFIPEIVSNHVNVLIVDSNDKPQYYYDKWQENLHFYFGKYGEYVRSLEAIIKK